MNDKDKTREELISELAGIRQQIAGLERLEAEFSHDICPGCMRKLHPDLISVQE